MIPTFVVAQVRTKNGHPEYKLKMKDGAIWADEKTKNEWVPPTRLADPRGK